MDILVYKGLWHSGKDYRHQLSESKQKPLGPFPHAHAFLEKEVQPSLTEIAFCLQLPHQIFIYMH